MIKEKLSEKEHEFFIFFQKTRQYSSLFNKKLSSLIQLSLVEYDTDTINYFSEPTIKATALFAYKYGYIPENCIKYENDFKVKHALMMNSPSNIRKIKSPSMYHWEIAIKKDASLILHNKNLSDEIFELAIKINSSSIQYIVSPTIKMIEMSCLNDPNNVRYIRNLPEYILHDAIERTPSCIQYIKNPSKVSKILFHKYSERIEKSVFLDYSYVKECQYIDDYRKELEFYI